MIAQESLFPDLEPPLVARCHVAICGQCGGVTGFATAGPKGEPDKDFVFDWLRTGREVRAIYDPDCCVSMSCVCLRREITVPTGKRL